MVTFVIRITADLYIIKKFTYLINKEFYFYYRNRKIKRLRKIILKAFNIFIINNDITFP